MGATQRYWNSIRHTEFFKSHPGLNEDELHRTVPIGMHGDGGAFPHNDSLFVLTWNSLIGSGPTRATRFLMTIVPKSEMVPGTMPAIMKVLICSFNLMLTGIDSNNDFLAERWKASLAQLRGDWEFYTMPSFLAFPKWNQVGRMCWKCLAVGNDEDPLKYSRFDKNAPWRFTRQDHETYLAGFADASLIPLLLSTCIGFRIELVMADVLHCLDLGVASHIVGNIFWILIANHTFASNIADSIKVLDALLIQWQKDNRIVNKYKGHVTPERVRTSKSWPKLKSKGAPMHPVASFALALAKEYKEHVGEDCVLVIDLLVQFYAVMDRNGHFFPEHEKREIQRIGSKLCRTYCKLAAKAAAEGERLWKATPKLHLFLHLCEWDVDMGNPRFFWCYADEDMVGQMIKAGESCHPKTLAISAMFKWLTLVFSEDH